MLWRFLKGELPSEREKRKKDKVRKKKEEEHMIQEMIDKSIDIEANKSLIAEK